jgi:hypothetical protein
MVCVRLSAADQSAATTVAALILGVNATANDDGGILGRQDEETSAEKS